MTSEIFLFDVLEGNFEYLEILKNFLLVNFNEKMLVCKTHDSLFSEV